ncbi:MAG: hypothetical protein ABR541_05200 [Candidatus Dormibacteria bacterium]
MTDVAEPDAEAQLRELESLLAKTRRVRRTIEALRRATGAPAARPPRRVAPSGKHPQGRPRGSATTGR